MYSLIIIDMQSDFDSSKNRETLKYCSQEIKTAMSKKASIIFVEYIGYSSTISSLTNLTSNYDKVYCVRKRANDGSEEISKLIRGLNLPSSKLRVCGVNTDFCVLETVFGLASKFRGSKLKVISKACNSSYYHEDGLETLRSSNKVEVI